LSDLESVGPLLVEMMKAGYFCRVWCQSEVSEERRWHVTFEKGCPRPNQEVWPWAWAEDTDLVVAVKRASSEAREREREFSYKENRHGRTD
jgi:hypothetical protein